MMYGKYGDRWAGKDGNVEIGHVKEGRWANETQVMAREESRRHMRRAALVRMESSE